MANIDLITEFIDVYNSLQSDDLMQETQRAQYKIEVLRSLDERKRDILPTHNFDIAKEYNDLYESLKANTTISQETKLQLRLDLLRQVAYSTQII